MSKKIKRSVKLEPDEAVVVASVEDWGFIVDACKMVLNTAELSEYSRQGWQRVIDNMEFWVNQSATDISDEAD